MPPYKLPDNQTQSGMQSRSSKNGTGDNFNELRFEDKIGEEEVYFHSEKDFNRVVENNDTLKVGFDKKEDGDQTIEIHNNQTVTVGNSESAEGSQTLTIWKDRTSTIETGNETHQIKKGNRTVTIDEGNDALTIGQGDHTIKVSAGKTTHEAMKSIELIVGQSSIKIEPAKITIKSVQIAIEGTAQVEVKAPMVEANGSAMLTLKGGVIMIN
jgi:type VI secretion system secreted protein VgrG